jgi:hypothetical protein
MKRFRLFRRAPADDPGEVWATRVLAPLAARGVECDVVPAVMARIAASRRAPRPFSLATRRPGLAWAAGLLSGLVALGVLGVALYAAAREGQQMGHMEGVAGSLGHVVLVFGRLFAMALGCAATVAAPIARALWALLQVAAPLLRGAGMAAAICGALSIIVSLYVFTHDRPAAPAGGARGGIRFRGGRHA